MGEKTPDQLLREAQESAARVAQMIADNPLEYNFPRLPQRPQIKIEPLQTEYQIVVTELPRPSVPGEQIDDSSTTSG